MGVALPDAIMGGLAGHRDLGFHAGMITDGVLRLVEEGVLTGRHKEIDTGIVMGMAIGSAALYAGLDGMPVQFRPASYTHHPAVLSRLRRLVSINAAVEVDLTARSGPRPRTAATSARSVVRPTSPVPRPVPAPARSSPCARRRAARRPSSPRCAGR